MSGQRKKCRLETFLLLILGLGIASILAYFAYKSSLITIDTRYHLGIILTILNFIIPIIGYIYTEWKKFWVSYVIFISVMFILISVNNPIYGILVLIRLFII